MMKALARTIEGKNSPFLVDIGIPKPTPGHVTVKVLASPINPSDDYFCHGRVNIKLDHEPYVCGNEGAGIITDVGLGVPQEAVGKKVSVWPLVGGAGERGGMWAQYAMVSYDACVFLGEHDSCEEFCELFVNPLTLLAFVRIAKEMGLKAIVHTAALSSLGKSLLKLCIAEGIDVIGVIRKKEDIKKLLDLGAKCALDLNDPNFVANLREATEKLGARVAFDAIAGDMTATIIKGMPDNSMVYTYGILSGTSENLAPVKEEMEKRNIKAQWFLVPKDKIMTDTEEKKKALEFIQNDVKNGGKLFKIPVAKRYKLEEFEKAFEEYKKVATEGKSVFVPNL